MAMTMTPNDPPSRGSVWRLIGWSLAALLLIIPLIAGQLTNEVRWSSFDFLLIGALLVSAGITFEMIARGSQHWRYRLAAAAAVTAGFGTIVSNAAVGIIGSEHEPINLGFYAVPVLALAGAFIVRFRALGMAVSMSLASVGYLILVMVGLLIGAPVGLFVIGPAVVWIGSAELFRRAAESSS
jgi:hypothetical protein